MGDFFVFYGDYVLRLGKTVFFFLVGINFCALQEVAFNWNYDISFFIRVRVIEKLQVKHHAHI